MQKLSLYVQIVKYSENKNVQNFFIQWTTKFKLLGIHYDVDLTTINKLNHDQKTGDNKKNY